ncbi:Thermostable carboxypeptidase 1 [Citrobacter freundii]|nr:Thermostable carboxypeptidase 1 [Citrobacter freundii]
MRITISSPARSSGSLASPHLSAIASWDMFTMMPSGGSKARGEALAELSVLEHQLLTDPKVATWIAAAQQEDLNDVEQANLREMSRLHHQASLLPESLVEAKSLAGSRCEHAWRSQRPANDWEGFSEKPERGREAQPRRGPTARRRQRLFAL